jgi:hypothetical protein
VVIDVGRPFVITHEGMLFLTGAGKAQFREFTPEGLVHAASMGWFDFVLLWDDRSASRRSQWELFTLRGPRFPIRGR